MDFLRKKTFIFGFSGFLLLLIFWFAFGRESEESVAIYTTPDRGTFNVNVTTTGELRAKNSTNIRGPEGLRDFRIYQVQIQKLVPEGTVVKKGDFVAELDRSEITTKLQDEQLELEEEESEFESAQLDSMLTLSEARDQLINLEYSLQEAEIAVEQSQYESPATQRQVQIQYDKAERALEQARTNYKTKEKQAELKLREIETDLKQQRREVARIEATMNEFTIQAPENGMVIYKRSRDGSKLTEGGSIQVWDPVVAQLPDFSIMNSETYVNEVDIQKVNVGQQVDIGLDAMPEKELSGSITSVANIGEQRPNSDSKVFQVVIEVNEADTTLRPAMTTSNTIHVNSVDSALYVPLETIHGTDSLNFVYKKAGMAVEMQQVVLGLMNDESVIVHEGVSMDDQLYLSTPEDTTDIETKYLPEEIQEKYKKEDELKADSTELVDKQRVRKNGARRMNNQDEINAAAQ